MVCGRVITALKTHPSLGFILIFELFQCMSYFSVQVMLFLYLRHELKYSLGVSIALYHTFLGCGYLMPVVCSVVADKWIGKYWVIVLSTFIGLLGLVLLTLGSTAPGVSGMQMFLPGMVALTFTGLFLRVIGTGGPRQVVRLLGSDQFSLPSEERCLHWYHQIFYYTMVVGTIFAVLMAPVLRAKIDCYGQLYCFPAAFLFATCTLFVALSAILAGFQMLCRKPAEGSPILEMILLLKMAYTVKSENLCDGEKPRKWRLCNASAYFTDEFICDVQATLRSLMLYLPLPIFWSLYEQQGSTWVYQASFMVWLINRTGKWSVEPDQMQVATHLGVFIAMPLVDAFLLRRWENAGKPLWRFIAGSLLAIAAFTVAAVLELHLEPSHPIIPEIGQGHIILYNTMATCPLNATLTYTNREFVRIVVIPPRDRVRIDSLPMTSNQSIWLDLESQHKCTRHLKSTTMLMLIERRAINVFIDQIDSSDRPGTFAHHLVDDLPFRDDAKCVLQLPLVGLLYNAKRYRMARYPSNVMEFRDKKGWNRLTSVYADHNHYGHEPIHLHPSKYGVKEGNQPIHHSFHMSVYRGGVYALFMIKTHVEDWDRRNDNLTDDWKGNLTELSPPNTVHMAWQIPQYALLSLAQFLYPVTLLQFTFRQVPPRMRPVLLAAWYLTIAAGNFIAAALGVIFHRLFWNYIMFIVLMSVNFFLMLVVVCNFKMVDFPRVY